MALCIISPNFPPMSWPCGAADFVRRYAAGMAETGVRVQVVTSNVQATTNLNSVFVEIIEGDWGFRHVWAVARSLRKKAPEVIDVQYEAAMYGGRSAVLLLPIMMLLLGFSGKLFLTLHSEATPRHLGRWARPLQGLLFREVFFYSATFRSRLLRWFSHRHQSFHVLGFPSNILDAGDLGLKSLVAKVRTNQIGSAQFLVYFGHINRGRGIEVLLESLLLLKTSSLRPKLLLMSKFDPVGDDYHRHLNEWVSAHGLQEQVEFSGRLEETEVSLLLGAADLCVLPFPWGVSFKNGTLAAAIEHLVPVVSTKSEETERELVEVLGEALVAPEDASALARAIEAMLRNADSRLQQKHRLRDLRDKLSWRSYIAARVGIMVGLGGNS